jgi:Flp pilus assembly protein TadG
MKHYFLSLFGILKEQKGTVAIIAALTIGLFVGFAALGIDVGHLYVVRNELQNAADAGALAGARCLYSKDGTKVNDGSVISECCDANPNNCGSANQIAFNAATSNNSENVAVEVDWNGGNDPDIQRGHWSFSTGTFTPKESTAAIKIWDYSTEDLDTNTDFINAVRVRTTRGPGTPASSFFARIFGYDSFFLEAEAIAYIGFAGTLAPEEVDQPIAICMQSIVDENGKLTCNVGRMINSGQNEATNESGGWTNFRQSTDSEDVCNGGTNSQEVKSLICVNGNPEEIEYGNDIATNGGEIQAAFTDMINCWENKTGKTNTWTLALPVINCPGNNIGTCEQFLGKVLVELVWITEAGQDPDYKNAPTQMTDSDGNTWSYAADADNTNGQERWNSFVQNFNLTNTDGSPAPYHMKSLYFKPVCSYEKPSGRSGGENFGVLAKIPVLVH